MKIVQNFKIEKSKSSLSKLWSVDVKFCVSVRSVAIGQDQKTEGLKAIKIVVCLYI